MDKCQYCKDYHHEFKVCDGYIDAVSKGDIVSEGQNEFDKDRDKILTDNGLGTSEVEKLAFVLGRAYGRKESQALQDRLIKWYEKNTGVEQADGLISLLKEDFKHE